MARSLLLLRGVTSSRFNEVMGSTMLAMIALVAFFAFFTAQWFLIRSVLR
jgi:hypothetical protein